MVLVFHLGFRQRGAVLDAPVDRLQPFVDVAAVQKLDERAGDDGLVMGAHGEVGIVPLAQDSQALEILALQVDVLFGVLAAGGADLHGRHLGLARAQVVIHFDFDGQAVAVPARHVGRVEARHGLGLDDEVLEDFVEGGAQVDAAVGVGRAVVQDEGGAAGAGGANALVEVLLLPPLEQLRLGLRQVGLHGESGFRQIDGLLQVDVLRIHCWE